MVQLLWLLLLPGILSAATHCTLSAVPQQIASEGAAEPAGAITVACSGATPARLIEGTVAVSFAKRVANRLAGDLLDGPVVEIDAGAGVWSPFASRASLSDASTINFENLRWTADSSGSFSLRVRGVRIEGAAEAIQAAVRFYLNERIEATSFLVTVARGVPALAASLQATLATRGPSPPDDADFKTMASLGSPFTAMRLSEGFASAFSAVSAASSQGTRFLVRFAGVPEGVRMLAPDVVIGSTGLIQTRSGGFGSAAGAGLNAPIGGQQLVLVRVIDAEINGQGGRLAVNPGTSGETLGRLRAAATSRGTPYIVFEVTGSDPTRVESVEIPAWVAVPPRFDTPYGESVVHATASLAPISENEGAHATAPVPRYRPVSPGSDCELAGDCGAGWFPKMRLVEPAPLSFAAVTGSGIQIGYAGIRNDGGGLLEWRVSIRSKQNATWLSVDPGSGVQNGGVRFDINPAGLQPGDYSAELVFEHMSPPTGRRDERVYPIALKVTSAAVTPPVIPPVTPPVTPPANPAPQPPTPVIRDVTVGPARLGTPFAPTSLITVSGLDLGVEPLATVAGKDAVILAASAIELSIVVPEDTPSGRVPLVVTSNGKPSVAWFLDVVPVAPVALFALNSDGDRNGDSTPAAGGQPIDLYVTGIPAGMTLSVRLHDRTLPARSEDAGAPGVRLIRVQVPTELPSMQTTAVIMADSMSSHPLDIWIR